MMAAALRIAEQGRGLASPNPHVGCVIVKQGRIIGSGFTQSGGRPHAEAVALAACAANGCSADINYEWRMGELMPFVGGEIVYQGKENGTFFNNILKASDFQIKSYSTVDLRAGIAAQNGSWEVTVFGRNVFNKVYTTSVTTFLDTQFRFTGRPTIYGVSAKFRMK